MRSIPARDLEPGDVLVGSCGGRTVITGDVEPSNLMMGCLVVETEHGVLYLDLDEEQIVDRAQDRIIDGHPATHVVTIEGGDCPVLLTEPDPDGDSMLAAAAVGHSNLTGREVSVKNLASGETRTFTATDCKEWFA